MPFDARWLSAHKTPLLAGGAGLVAVLALRSRSKAAAASPQAGSALSAGPGTVSGSAGFSSSQLDQYDQLAGAISNANDQIGLLGTQVAGLAASQVPSAKTSLAPKGYAAIPTTADIRALTAAGQTVYAEVAPNDYIPVISGGHYTAAGGSLLSPGYRGTLYAGVG